MAILLNDDKLQDPNAQNQNENQNQSAPGSQAPLVGGDSATVNQGANAAGTGAAGVGPGGTGKWTNIQAYLNANKDVDTGATKILSDKVGTQFNKERSDLDTSANQAKTQSEEQVKGVNDAWTNKDTYLKGMSENYQWRVGKDGSTVPGGAAQKVTQPTIPAGDPQKYADYYGKFDNALKAQYTAPETFDYGFKSDTTGMASMVGNDDAFNQWLGDEYQNKAGGQLTAGGRALQRQLNVSNEPLAKARQDLLKQWADLGDYRNLVAKNTSQALAKNAGDFRTNQAGLNTWLTNQQSQADSEVGMKESDARAQYDLARRQGSGFSDFYNLSRDQANTAGLAAAGAQQEARNAAGLAGENLSYEALQRELDNYGNFDYRQFGLSDVALQPIDQRRDRNRTVLNSFYQNQDAKFQDTADLEKRKFNAIADLLGQSGARKSKGFQVRGSEGSKVRG